MKLSYLEYLVPLWVVGILIYVYISPGEYKLVPILTVLFMGAGFCYALVKFVRSNSAATEKPKVMNIARFERNVKIAKPLRLLGMVFLIIQLLVWLEVFRFRYDDYLSLLIIVSLLTYLLFLVFFWPASIEIKGLAGTSGYRLRTFRNRSG